MLPAGEHQQIVLVALRVSEEQVLADFNVEQLLNLGAALDCPDGVMVDPLKGDVKALEQVVDALFLRKALVVGRAVYIVWSRWMSTGSLVIISPYIWCFFITIGYTKSGSFFGLQSQTIVRVIAMPQRTSDRKWAPTSTRERATVTSQTVRHEYMIGFRYFLSLNLR